MNSILTSKWTKVVVFLACLIPCGQLLWRAFHNGLAGFPDSMDFGANPIEFITHATGDWTLRFLVITLAITPLRRILRQPQLIRFRRMLGLFAFFYGCLHFGTWIGLDKFFAWSEMWKDVQKRRFITVGFAAFVLMIPLAVTSTAGMIRRLGGTALADAASRDLCERDFGRDSLLLAGEIGCSQAAFVRGDCGNLAGLPDGDVDIWARAEDRCGRRCSVRAFDRGNSVAAIYALAGLFGT